MAHSSFTLNTLINASPEEVRNFITTLNNHPQIHPLIVSVHHDGTTTAADGTPIQEYHITDRMKLGPLTIKFTYRVLQSIGPTGEIIYDAFQSPGIHLHNTTILQPEGSSTLLKENVEIDAPLFLIKTVYQGAIRSHEEMFSNLKKLLEQREKTL